MYLVMSLSKECDLDLYGGRTAPLKLIWADGMIGAAPIFDNYDKALNYANGKASLVLEVRESSNP